MIIFVDMDEVIADTYGAHLELYNSEFNTQIKLEDCHGKGIKQCVPEEHLEMVKGYTARDGFFRNLEVFPDSQEVLRELSKEHEVYIASAAMEYPNSLREKSDWLDEHFPFIPWQHRILCGHKYILKGDLLIDDHSRNLKPFEGRKIMFTSPHNMHETEFERADNWKEIAAKLL